MFRLVGQELVHKAEVPRLTLMGLAQHQFHTVLDVGANTGQFAREIREFLPDANLVCFEPLPEPYAELEAWADSEGEWVSTMPYALGEESGEVEMFLHEDHSESSSLLKTTELKGELYPFTRSQRPVTIQQRTLDACTAEMGLQVDRGTLIKLDVQGFEDRVIKGGKQTFRSAGACILEVNLDPLYESQASFAGLVSLLDELGYEYAGNMNQTYADDFHCIYIDAVFINRSV